MNLLVMTNHTSDLSGLFGLIVGSELFVPDSFSGEPNSKLSEEIVRNYFDTECDDGEILLFLKDDTSPEDAAIFSQMAENYQVQVEICDGLVMRVTSDDSEKRIKLGQALNQSTFFTENSLARLEARAEGALGTVHMVCHRHVERQNPNLRQLYMGMALGYGATAMLVG